jgi:hypothetical protein
MDLGYPYSEEETRDMAIQCKKYKRHLLEMKEVPDTRYRCPEEPKRIQSSQPQLPMPVLAGPIVKEPVASKVYNVERIFKNHCKVVYRKQKPHKKYFVKWTGYTNCTWQYKNVLIKDLGYYVFNKLLF